MLTQYFIAFLTTGTLNFLLGMFVILKGPKRRLNQVLALYSFSLSLWSIFEALGVTARNESMALLFWRINHLGVIFIPVFLVHLIFLLLNIYRDKKKLVIISYVVAGFFAILNTTPLLISGVSPKFSFRYFINPGSFYYVFFGIWIIWAAYGNFKLFKEYFKTTGYRKNQMQYFCWSLLFSYIAGAPNFLPTFNIEIPILMPFGTYAIPLYALITTIAIIRYRLMDISVAVSRTAIFVVVYTLVLGFPFVYTAYAKNWLMYVLKENWLFAPLGLMAGLATVGPFIYIYLNRKAEALLLREQRQYQDTLKRASMGMTRVRNLPKLLKLIVYTLVKAVRIEYASIYIRDKDNNGFDLKAIRGDCRVRLGRTRNDTEEEVALSLPRNDTHIPMDTALVKWLTKHQEPLVAEEIKSRLQDNYDAGLEELKNQLDYLNISVVVPSLVEDRLLGFTCLGDKRSGKIYTEDDLRIFTVLANQAALAIENARFFEDSKEMQDQISQAEKMATIGTMADGLSHQINNRFHALSLIAGDTLDTLKITDTSSYTAEQKELFAQINYGLERIIVNVTQGGEVVQGMLKYTRKGGEGFAPVTLDSIIDSTLEMVQYKVKISEIDLIRDYPKELPLIHANLAQMQEVFFNLIDNAYESMLERKDTLKEENYRPRITISSSFPSDGLLTIKVEDNGLGARPETIKKMFTPFFTTKATSNRRKGTGLGLYVIKKIITENHQGRINTESNHKQWMRFTIELPIAR